MELITQPEYETDRMTVNVTSSTLAASNTLSPSSSTFLAVGVSTVVSSMNSSVAAVPSTSHSRTGRRRWVAYVYRARDCSVASICRPLVVGEPYSVVSTKSLCWPTSNSVAGVYRKIVRAHQEYELLH